MKHLEDLKDLEDFSKFSEEQKAFLKFLYDRKALRQYVYNKIEISIGDTYANRLFPKRNVYMLYILYSYSFRWASTPQGHVYWSSINAEWYDIYENMKVANEVHR